MEAVFPCYPKELLVFFDFVRFAVSTPWRLEEKAEVLCFLAHLKLLGKLTLRV